MTKNRTYHTSERIFFFELSNFFSKMCCTISMNSYKYDEWFMSIRELRVLFSQGSIGINDFVHSN